MYFCLIKLNLVHQTYTHMYRHIHINPRALQSIGIARRMNNKLVKDINSTRAKCDSKFAE